MPKINAATVPEHRRAQRRAILDAASALILDVGFTALKFGDLADRTGLSRPSIYEYFRTKSELAVALIAEEAPALQAVVSAKMAKNASAEQKLVSFVRTNLELVQEGRHEVVVALALGDMDDEVHTAIEAAHHGMFKLLVPVLQELGIREVETCAGLVGHVVIAAGQTLRRDRSNDALIELAVTFALGGVLACAKRN